MRKELRSKSLPEIKAILSSHKHELRKEFGVKSIGVFGSYVRKKNRKEGDIDIHVELEISMGFFKFLRLEKHLSQLLGVQVDLVTKNALKPFIGKHILAEIQYV